jgi:phosphatidate cytidylyltransferase
MRKRTLSALGIAAIGFPAILLGGFFYYLLMGTFLIGAAWEYVHLFRAVKLQPQILITTGGVALITFMRALFPNYALPTFEATILIALAYHLYDYEHGRDQAALDFSITVTALVYIGWIGAYLFDLRNLPDGGWWMMLVMMSLWLSDSGAYSIGVAYGKHKIAPRLSPKKSWEGYIASIFTGIIGGTFFAYAFSTYGGLAGEVTLLQGAIIGFLMGTIPTLGDLGESMIKRQSGLKDSSDVIPGHGGFFDRIDSWLWGAMIGYYFIVWFILKP